MSLKHKFHKWLDEHKYEKKVEYTYTQNYPPQDCANPPQQACSLSYLEQIDQRIAQLRAQQYQMQQTPTQVDQQIAALEAQSNCYRQQMNQQQSQYQSQYQSQIPNQCQPEQKPQYPKGTVFFVNKKNGHVNVFNTHKSRIDAIKDGIEGYVGTEIHNYGAKKNHKLIKKIGKAMEVLGVFKRNMAISQSYQATKDSFAVPADRLPPSPLPRR